MAIAASSRREDPVSRRSSPERAAISPESGDAESSGPRVRDSLEVLIDTDVPERARDEHAPELPTLRRFAGYELLGRIAVGGMAEVFLARERSEGAARLLALKVIRASLERDAGFAEMFMREGAVALGLRHPNVCHVYRFGVESGHAYLAMELVSGTSVRELIAHARKTRTKIPPHVAAKIASSVAEALHSAHVARDERGRALEVVHQDVSPHNVMVAWDGTVKLLDFGVAQSSLETTRDEAAKDTSTDTDGHTIVRGKLAYLSPEQCTGAKIDARSDVFSLGIVLHEMLTGERIFRRDGPAATMRAIAVEPLKENAFAGIPAGLARVLVKALSRSPRHRYASAAEMQEDLERYLADERIVVTSAKIAAALQQIVGEGYGRAPALDARPEVVAALPEPRGDATALPFPLVREKAPARGARIAWMVAALAVIGLVAMGALMMMRAGDVEPPRAEPMPAPVAAPPVVAEPAAVVAEETVEAAPAEVAPAAEVQVEERAADVEPADSTARERRRAERARRRASVPTTPGGFVEDPGF
ncbi:Serine/threonine protein kinase PrkC, regulator of stationary phase [Sandaracinus amylolyticus]|nr:Serine/threonine protein kinase PrkC, regulator of stationary phase [Sandaracinus amylolyticus]